MMLRAVTWSARHPLVVLAITAFIVVGGYFAQKKLPRDAIPDLSDPQIVLIAEWMGHPAAEVAAKVTDVVTAELSGIPEASAVRGASMSGMSYIDVVFVDSSAMTRGRAEIAKRMTKLGPRLPRGVRVRVGPEASSTGWIFQYAIMPPPKAPQMPMAEAKHTTQAKALASLRKFHDTELAPELAKIHGVAEVAPIGGNPEEVIIETSAEQLRAAGVAFSDVVSTLNTALDAPAPTFENLRDATLPSVLGASKPSLAAVARVSTGPEMATGIADVDGATPAVGGIVIAKRDADVHAVIHEVKLVLDRARPRLPTGTKLGVVYDRSELATGVENTLLRAVAEEVAVVALIVLMFLVHLRSALVPLITLPLVVLITFVSMRFFGVPATVMSLGGI